MPEAGKYGIVYADPPWRYDMKRGNGVAENHYPTMSIEEICALPVTDLAARDSALFLWATFPQLNEAFRVIEAWGFKYKTLAFLWLKQNRKADSWFYGMGFWTRSNAEVCLLATRGHPKRQCAGIHQFVISHIEQHSKKPDEVRDKIVKLMGDQPRVELFARQQTPGYGAVFDLYEDANGNKEFDSEDTKIGTLKESDAGYHTAEGLLAKGYFVKESKAPEGYQLDGNAYYFAITEDGQVAVVENGEAGRGFTNEAYRGNLKITKDSSDGRKDGFAFEVKSADGSYCETFTSPKSGVIEVKGLRVGIYTVTEISNRASRDYIIPDAATVEIKADETATVQFFNEKPEKPTTPDNPDNPKTPSNPSTPSNPDKAVPQTGDDNFIFLYGGLLALAVIGGGLFAAAYFKKGKYSRNTPKRKVVGIAVVSLCGLLALGSGFLMVRDLNQYSESAGAYEDIASHVELPEQTEAPEDDNTETEPAGEDPSVVLPTVDFDALRETGPDIIGWLTLPDTAINYPVTQTDDNEYYLHHLYDGTYNKTGCLFADYENQEDFSDRNTIIYGHNMRDGSMFATLNEYDEQSYYDGHPQMYLVTPDGGYVVEIFTAFVAKPSESGSDTSPWRLSFKDDGAYTTWLSEMAGRSVIETDVTVTSSDKVLTLSTCTPGGASRFIVMGKLAAVND